MFLDEVRALAPDAAGYIMDMIALLAADAASRGVKRAFLLASEGTIASGIYQDRFGAMGVEVVPAGEEKQGRLREFIEIVKQNKVDEGSKAEFSEFVRGIGESYVILGCTELPLLADCAVEGVHLLDPMQAAINYVVKVYAEAERNS